jgi:hypothetical protein
MDRISAYIDDLRHAVTIAGLNYEIWWIYVEEETRKKYIDSMNKYPLFFQTSLHAHFAALVIALYRLYENNTKTVNIPGLLRIISNDHPFEEKSEEKIAELYEKAKPLFLKVAILRNNAFGHRSSKLTSKDAFAKAEITPNELKQLLETTKELLNEITTNFDNSFHTFNLGAGESVMQLLEDIKENRLIK